MNIVSPINCQTGYGITGYNIWKQIFDKDPTTTLFNIGDISIENHWAKNNIINSLKNQKNVDITKPCLKIWHTNDILFRLVGSSPYGCLTFFELDTLPENEIKNINKLDKIFVASSWAKNVLINNNVTIDIIVCPQGVDRDIFNEEIQVHKEDNKYIFINIGKWEKRKGHDILYQLFNSAFNENDDVELWMINSNPFLTQEQTAEWIKLYKDSKLGDKIKIFPRISSQVDLAKLMQYANCGIFPSRAEGWNNEAIEMLSIGKPIIITNYSAHTEYCNKDNSYLVNIDTLEKAHDDMWFKNTEGNWASLNSAVQEQFISYMRYVFDNRISNNDNGIVTSKNYTWNKAASTILEKLNG